MGHHQPRSRRLLPFTWWEGDVQFLERTLAELPKSDDHNRPVTLELNGQTIVRARGKDPPTTELVLTNSHRSGQELRLACNREFLARATKLGFRDLHFTSTE